MTKINIGFTGIFPIYKIKEFTCVYYFLLLTFYIDSLIILFYINAHDVGVFNFLPNYKKTKNKNYLTFKHASNYVAPSSLNFNLVSDPENVAVGRYFKSDAMHTFQSFIFEKKHYSDVDIGIGCFSRGVFNLSFYYNLEDFLCVDSSSSPKATRGII